MTNSFKKLAAETLTSDTGGSLSAVYEAPAGSEVLIKHMRIVNQTPAQKTVTMWQKTGSLGGLDDDNYLVLPPITLEAGGWAEFEGTIIVPAGESIYANADSADDVNLFIYGLEIT